MFKPPKVSGTCLDHSLDVFVARDVSPDGNSPYAILRLDIGCHLLAAFDIDIRDHNIRALTRQAMDYGLAQPLRPAGYDGGFAC